MNNYIRRDGCDCDSSPCRCHASVTDMDLKFMRKLSLVSAKTYKRGEKKTPLFSILDFKNKTQSNTNSVNLSSTMYKINLQKKLFNPLPGHVYQPQTFPVNKVIRMHYPNRMYYTELFTMCGEDDPIQGYFRSEMTYLFFDANYQALNYLLIFHCLINRAAYELILQSQKYSSLCDTFYNLKYTQDLSPDTSKEALKKASHLKFPPRLINMFQELALHHKLLGFKLAQNTLELLNNPENLPDFHFLTFLRNLFYYSIVNIGLTFFDQDDYKNVLTFVNGFVSTTLVKPIIDKFNSIMGSMDTVQQEQFKFVHNIFSYIHSYFIRNINSIYIPNYNLDILFEYQGQLEEYLSSLVADDDYLLNLISDCSTAEPDLFRNSKIKVFCQLIELHNYLTKTVLPNVYDKDTAHVSTYPPQKLFMYLKRFLSIYPSNVTFIQLTYKSMSIFERLFHLHWIAAYTILDNVFTESLYLFITKFSGITFYAGFNQLFIDDTLHEISKLPDTSMQEYLTRRVIYLTRMISFLMYRHRIYLRNLGVVNPYPEDPRFDMIRMKSRKVTNIKEAQITSFLIERIQLENYPRSFQNSRLFQDYQPNNPKYLIFNDDNFDINQTKSTPECESFDLLSSSLKHLKLSEFGLLNIDYRPNLNTVSNNYLNLTEAYYKRNEITLKHYIADREKILDSEHRHKSYP